MRISIAWLKEYVQTTLDTEALAHKLTMVGLEAEEIIQLDPGVGDVVVARIRNVLPHPNSDRLSVCEVETGSRILRVVCGAPNARPGIVVPLALEGTRLPSGMTIRSSRIRGVESDGMLCSGKELGLSEDASGLLELPNSLRIGQSLRDALGLDDTAVELNITPNRPDCLSIVGVAREVATAENVPLNVPQPVVVESDVPVASKTSVQILEPTLCPRYAARVVLGVQVGQSPEWLQKRLNAVGLRTINNVVDVTNYVLMELGHPLHAFDYDLLAEYRIVVRRARPDETMTTLDGVHRSLTTETLVIADAEKPVALAGIMGGKSSEVSDATTNLLLESAYFNPVSIRRTAKALGISTEASYRFERGADIEGVTRALDRATELIVHVAGGKVCKGVIDVYPKPLTPTEIRLRPERVAAVLGIEVPTEAIERILRGLGCRLVSANPMRVIAPTFRPDLTREVDLIEEVARVWGYDNIPTTFPGGVIPSKVANPHLALRRQLVAVMCAAGYNEACNYGFTSPQLFDKMRIPEGDELRNALVVANPLSVEISVMRTSLLPSLMQNLETNRRHRVERVALFELAREFHPRRVAELPYERWMLAGVLSGAPPKHWANPAREPDFADVKGLVETVLRVTGVTDWTLTRAEHPSLHPGRSAVISRESRTLATFGEVHPGVLKNFDLTRRAFLFEIDVDALAECAAPSRSMQAISPFPSTPRDLAVVVDADLPAETVARLIQQTVPPDLLGSLSLFDVYVGDQIPANKKSLAYAIEYRSPDRTLTDAEVDKIQAQVVRVLAREVGAELRA
jgi:phenylalanyl-tRNA synthetase beta chain